MPSLVIRDPSGAARAIDCGASPLLVGRAASADVVLDDPSLSRQHARLECIAGRLYLIDLESRNGTTVNGAPVRRAELRHGDRIRFGRVEAMVEAPEVPSVDLSAAHVLIEDGPQTIIQPAPESLGPAPTGDVDRFARLVMRLAAVLVGNRSLDEVLDAIMALAFEHIPCERGFLLLGESEETLRPRVARQRDGGLLTAVSISRTVCRRVLTERIAMLAADAEVDPGLRDAASIRSGSIRSFISAPLWHEGRVAGLLYLDNPLRQQFSRGDLDLLVALSNYAAVAIDRASIADQLAAESRRRDRLQRYHSPAVVQHVLERAGDERSALEARELDVTVLMADLVGFTTLAEQLPPADVARMLNIFFEQMVEVVFRFDGTLDKFIGDGLMAVFGAPIAQPDHAERAVKAALAMSETLQLLNASGRIAPLAMRTAIHTGIVIAGDVGSKLRRDYTVLGDTVNTCARMMAEVCEPDQIVASQVTVGRTNGVAAARSLGICQLRGRASSIELFAIVPGPPDAVAGSSSSASA